MKRLVVSSRQLKELVEAVVLEIGWLELDPGLVDELGPASASVFRPPVEADASFRGGLTSGFVAALAQDRSLAADDLGFAVEVTGPQGEIEMFVAEVFPDVVDEIMANARHDSGSTTVEIDV